MIQHQYKSIAAISLRPTVVGIYVVRAEVTVPWSLTDLFNFVKKCQNFIFIFLEFLLFIIDNLIVCSIEND